MAHVARQFDLPRDPGIAMTEWFLMIVFTTHLTFVGPFTEKECHDVKDLMFRGINSTCVEGAPKWKAVAR